MDPNKQKTAMALKNDTSRSASEICQILGVCRNTYYKYIRSRTNAATADGERYAKIGQSLEKTQ